MTKFYDLKIRCKLYPDEFYYYLTLDQALDKIKEFDGKDFIEFIEIIEVPSKKVDWLNWRN